MLCTEFTRRGTPKRVGFQVQLNQSSRFKLDHSTVVADTAVVTFGDVYTPIHCEQFDALSLSTLFRLQYVGPVYKLWVCFSPSKDSVVSRRQISCHTIWKKPQKVIQLTLANKHALFIWQSPRQSITLPPSWFHSVFTFAVRSSDVSLLGGFNFLASIVRGISWVNCRASSNGNAAWFKELELVAVGSTRMRQYFRNIVIFIISGQLWVLGDATSQGSFRQGCISRSSTAA